MAGALDHANYHTQAAHRQAQERRLEQRRGKMGPGAEQNKMLPGAPENKTKDPTDDPDEQELVDDAEDVELNDQPEQEQEQEGRKGPEPPTLDALEFKSKAARQLAGELGLQYSDFTAVERRGKISAGTVRAASERREPR